MNKTNIQEPTFSESISIFVHGPKKIELHYLKRFDDGKQYGHMDDFQIYEKLSIEAVGEFLASKNIELKECSRTRRCKNIKTYCDILLKLRYAVTGAMLDKAINRGVNQ